MRRRGRRESRRRADSVGHGGRSEEQRKTGPRRMPNKLFVGNLDKVTKRELEEAFGRFGRLQDVWVSQKPAGFAFVEFLNSKDASECVQALDGRYLLGSRLRVEFAKTEASQPARPRAKRERASSPLSRRSRRRSAARGSDNLALSSSSTRLLPPPKTTAAMLAPVYDRSPSPLVLLRRGESGSLYDDRAAYRAWDDSARLSRVPTSVLLPSIRNRSHSPRTRSPLPLPVVDRDLLSSSGRLLAPPLPPLPSSYTSASYIGSRAQYSPLLVRRYDSRDRSPVRYKSRSRSRDRGAMRLKSRSPLPARSRSRSPVRPAPSSQIQKRTRSPSRSPKPVPRRPPERLLGKTPPLPSRSHSSSPQRYDQLHTELKGREAPVTKSQHERSRSPLAYSSRNILRAYTPPSPPVQPKEMKSGEKQYTMSPVRKRNSPPPKAYALSSDRFHSPGWSKSRSKSLDGKYSSRSPVHRTDNRSSSSTSPPRYGRSPDARENSPPLGTKHEAASPVKGRMKVLPAQRSPSIPKRGQSPVQHYRRTYASRSPVVVKRERSPVYQRPNSPIMRRDSPGFHTQMSRRRVSPETTHSKLESYRTARQSPGTASGVQWSHLAKRSDENRKRSPGVSAVSVSRNGRSPPSHSHTVMRSDRVSSAGAGRVESSPASRDRRSPRHRR